MTELVLRPRATYSQAQQDVILQSIFDKIGTTNKCCVEFGFNSETLDGGSGANTARLILEDGWTGLLLDKDYQNVGINLHRALLTPENIGDVFQSHGVPQEPDYVSIDVDSVDLWLFRGMLQAGCRPRVVSVEYNSNYGIDDCVTVRPGTVNTNDQCYGASLRALYTVASEFGYVLAAVEPGLDLFFVQHQLWLTPLSLEECALFTRLSVDPVPTPERIAAVMMDIVRSVILHCPPLKRDISALLDAVPHTTVLIGQLTPKGEDGCLEMHKQAIREAAAAYAPALWIMEDDCEFHETLRLDAVAGRC